MSRVRSLAVAMALTAMLSACGSDDSDSEPQAEESATNASESASEPANGEDPFCGVVRDIVGSSKAPDQETIQELADKAPDEISDDFQVLADAMGDPQSADQTTVEEAQTSIQAWGQENCTS